MRHLVNANTLPLYYLSSLAGLVMVVGGIWLLYKEKIYIDRESKQIIEVDTALGKFKTNIPALMLFALGFVPLIYPLAAAPTVSHVVYLSGNVDGAALPHSLQVYAAIRAEALLVPGSFRLNVPISDFSDIKLLYAYDNTILIIDYPKQLGADEPEVKMPPRRFTLPATVDVKFPATETPRPPGY